MAVTLRSLRGFSLVLLMVCIADVAQARWRFGKTKAANNSNDVAQTSGTIARSTRYDIRGRRPIPVASVYTAEVGKRTLRLEQDLSPNGKIRFEVWKKVAGKLRLVTRSETEQTADNANFKSWLKIMAHASRISSNTKPRL